MSKHIPQDMKWFSADIIQQFTFANGDNPLTWINTHLISATSPEEALKKAWEIGELYNETFINSDQVEVTSTFRGLKDLLLIYEALEDGSEISWTEYDDLTEEQITAMITPKERLGAFVLHSDESPVTKDSEAKDEEDGLDSADALNAAAQAIREKGDLHGAVALYEQSLRTLRKFNRLPELAYTLRHAADLHSQLGQLERAAREIAEASNIYSNTAYSSPLDLANSLRIAALNRERQAKSDWQEAEKLYGSLNIQAGAKEARRHISMGDPQ